MARKKKVVGRELQSVRRTSRTPYKHWILDMLMGKIVGVGWTRKTDRFANFTDYPFSCVDLCAGDGTVEIGEHTSSPLIMSKHCWYAENPANDGLNPFHTELTLIEQQEQTVEVLRKSVSGYEKKPAVLEVLMMDARRFEFYPMHATHPYFINADPNAISELPIAKDFGSMLTPATTFTVTLGCNVGGMKRMAIESRLRWYEYIGYLSSDIPNWHDVILCSLLHDASQWAYLSRVPTKWSSSIMSAMKKKGYSFGPYFRTHIVSMKCSRDKFNDELNRLFLTEKERGA